ncbi:MAG: hypothetical protein MMC33_007405, partial [Icmadophila ericetorum]|nr:hypothetical protein [Icmadophila ericetorum]
GRLHVTYEDQEIYYDWAKGDPSTIDWVAFCSNCTHQVPEITKGYRVTLTYNLYFSQPLGSISQPFASTDARGFPLYEGTKHLLENPPFMEQGGTLGYCCENSYAHTIKSQIEKLPCALKGHDAIIYSVFSHCGHTVQIRPIIWKSYEEVEDSWTYNDQEALDQVNKEAEEKEGNHVGKDLHKLKLTNLDWEDNNYSEILESSTREYEVIRIDWLNSRLHSKPALVHLTSYRKGELA